MDFFLELEYNVDCECKMNLLMGVNGSQPMRVDLIDNIAVVRPLGPMVSEVVEDLHAALTGLVRREMRPIVVDLSEVDLITSAGLGLLYAALKETAGHGGSLVLAAPRPDVIRVVQEWGLDRFMAMYPSVGEACAAAHGAPDAAPPV